ncbi:PiggyBac transposable element-derived protein 4 [Cucumispora dikerogammari]|nr:PiggyBac transposable element-derived protein 4 [Cucumispora dikerogammari]
MIDAYQHVDLRRKYVYDKMSHSRFLFIRKHFRLTTHSINEYSEQITTEEKTKELFESVNNILENLRALNKNLSIDESTIAHKGRFSDLVYNKNKPNKWGIKLCALCSLVNEYAQNNFIHE